MLAFGPELVPSSIALLALAGVSMDFLFPVTGIVSVAFVISIVDAPSAPSWSCDESLVGGTEVEVDIRKGFLIKVVVVSIHTVN